MLTDKLGDYMRFTFTGTAISIFGTRGVKQGEIRFFYDDEALTFDRGYPKLVCNEKIFEVSGLPYGEHQVTAFLLRKGTNPKTGKQDGVFSVQRIKYTVPDDLDD
ncbi:hypothetical protein M407DRAFT_11001 [Tulasnella calospora MUT 4182]|uniref:Uncharacterized protein n=1 Tax=Tulasnella calospora MUT 4182 TaxID=1051891 RepID=A0A0C3Q7V5_9AGAM|nr:hypothetical protein M407DRAFT_11001 [Tulasnella calospora MUT 4182]